MLTHILTLTYPNPNALSMVDAPEQQLTDRKEQLNQEIQAREQQLSEGAAKREELIAQMSQLIQQKEVWYQCTVV